MTAALVRFAKNDEANDKKSRALARYKLAVSIDDNTQAALARDRLIDEGISDSDSTTSQ